MSDDYNHSWPDDPADNDGQPRRSGMPPVTGERIQRGRDPLAKQLKASQPDQLTRRPDGPPSPVVRGLAVVALIVLIFVVPFLTRDSNRSSTPSRPSSNPDAIVGNLTTEDLCSGPLLDMLREQGTNSDDSSAAPPGSSLERMCENLTDVESLIDDLPQGDE